MILAFCTLLACNPCICCEDWLQPGEKKAWMPRTILQQSGSWKCSLCCVVSRCARKILMGVVKKEP